MQNLVNSFKGKKVFITGHSGFKGSWLSIYLNMLGAKVYGYSLNKPVSNPCLFEIAKIDQISTSIDGDINDYKLLKQTIVDIQPDFIFHLAAQPIVSVSKNEPRETIITNVVGTLNLLESLRALNNNCSVVIITSDKCYYPTGSTHFETDKLGGLEPYACSKAAAEIISEGYRKTFFNNNIRLATARAGNTIGGGDWGYNRLIPDIILSIENREPIAIRCPDDTRPWIHVLDTLTGYLTLSSKLSEDKNHILCQAWNFAPIESGYTVRDVVSIIMKHYGSNIPVSYGNERTGTLKISNRKATHFLKWKAKYDLEQTIINTINWYRDYYRKQDAYKLCGDDINNYINHDEHDRVL